MSKKTPKGPGFNFATPAKAPILAENSGRFGSTIALAGVASDTYRPLDFDQPS